MSCSLSPSVFAQLKVASGSQAPCEITIEARKLKKGFSVVYSGDGGPVPRTIKLGSTKRDYNWRLFAKMIRRLEEGCLELDHRHLIEVSGEDGIQAEILTLAWARDMSYLEWLLAQSDQSLEYLEKHMGSLLDENNYKFLMDLFEMSEDLYRDCDVLSLFLNHYSIHELHASIEARSMELWEAEQKERATQLAPFIDDINSMIQGWERLNPFSSGMNAYMVYRLKQGWVRHYVTDWVLKYSEIPKGLHDLGSTPQHNLVVGELDFDELAELGK